MSAPTIFLAPDADDEPTVWLYRPDAPDAPTALLRRCDLSPEGRAILWPRWTANVPHMRTIIVAPNVHAAVAVAREEHVRPHALTTTLVTRPDALRGRVIRPFDRVVWSSASWPSGSWQVLDEIDRFLDLARMAGVGATTLADFVDERERPVRERAEILAASYRPAFDALLRLAEAEGR